MKRFGMLIALSWAGGLANPWVGQAAVPAVDNNGGATNLSPGVAQLRGTLADGPADVSVFWGTTDGDTNGPWANRSVLTGVGNGPFAVNVSDLLYGPTYYYRCFASNASGTAWAPATTAGFTTLKPWGGTAASLRHRWSFNDGTMNDSVGTAHGMSENENVTVAGKRLLISGTGRMLTSQIGNPISNKTLVVWTSLLDPGNSTSGSALTLEDSAAGGIFDGIVYGQFLSSKWAAGSASNAIANIRSQTPQLYGKIEVIEDPDEVMIAIAYASDNRITVYRNGVLYGSYTKGSLFAYPDTAVVQIGQRNGSNGNTYQGYINEARIYGTTLSSNTVLQLAVEGPDSIGTGVSLTNSRATEFTSTSAVLNATLACPGAGYDVQAYWNVTNCGTDAALWANVQHVGAWTNVDSIGMSCLATGLTPATPYYFTFRATNATDDLWATNVLRFGPLAVDNGGGATNMPHGAALLQGTLYGTDPADVSIFWGLTDGGTNGPWANTNMLIGMTEGPFSTTASNLLCGGTYYYRCYASNGSGTVWAPATSNFTLPPSLMIVLDEKAGDNQRAFADKVSTKDLVNAVNSAQQTLSRVRVFGYKPYSEGRGLFAASVNAPDFILNNGDNGGNTKFWDTFPGNCAFDGDWGESGELMVTYYLNTNGLARRGYDLKTIDIFTAHEGGRAGIQFEAFVNYVGNGRNWVSLGAFASSTPDGPQQAHHMQLAACDNPGVTPFAVGVAAIRFALWGTGEYGEGWREIDVQGKARPPLPAGTILTVR